MLVFTCEVGEHLLVVADEEGVRHVGQLLGVLLLGVQQRRRLRVRHDVVHEGSAARAFFVQKSIKMIKSKKTFPLFTGLFSQKMCVRRALK